MSLIVNTNVGSLNAQRSLAASGAELKTAMERLSSGKRINSAADDAAGFAVAERMTAQIRGLNMAVKNVNDGLSYLKTVDGALDTSMRLVQRIYELSVQASNGTLSQPDKTNIQMEISSLIDEVDRVYYETDFNGKQAMPSSWEDNKVIQVGVNSGDTLEISLGPSAAVDFLGAAEGFSLWSDASFRTSAETTPPVNGLGATSFNINSASGQTLIEISANQTATEIENVVNAQAAESGVFARAYNWGFLEGNESLFGNSFSIKVNGHTASTNSFSYENLAFAINEIREETDVTASAFEWGIQIADNKGGDIKLEVESSNQIFAYAPWKYDEKVELTGGSLDSMTLSGSVKFVSASEFSVDKIGNSVPTIFDSNPRSLEGFLDQTLADNDSLTSYFDENYGNVENLDGVNVEHAAWVANFVSQAALDAIVEQRAAVGAYVNRLEFIASNLMNVAEFTTAARSRIEDADFAAESARLAKAQVLQQMGTAMLAQANAQPQLALSLIKS